jgi:hypothetical protein
MRRGVVMALVLGASALAAPSSAGASVTQEDRAFAATVKAFDAEEVAVLHDPALQDAVRARRQAATACLDTARSLGARHDGSEVVGAIFYAVHAIGPLFSALVGPAARYGHALRQLRLRDPVLRSARAVQLLNVRSVAAFAGVTADFCGPLRAWQGARFGTVPAPIEGAVEAFRSSPDQNGERTAKLRRASVRLRAVGVRLAVRERFVGVRSALDLDPIFKDDQVLAALDSPVTDP